MKVDLNMFLKNLNLFLTETPSNNLNKTKMKPRDEEPLK
jgi:hypothetical protein